VAAWRWWPRLAGLVVTSSVFALALVAVAIVKPG
jgi:hypothetical protein